MSIDTPFLLATNAIAIFMVSVIMFSSTISRKLRASVLMTIAGLVFWQDAIFFADNAAGSLEIWNTAVFIGPTVAVVGFYLFIHYLHTTTVKERSSVLLQALPVLLVVASLLQLKVIWALEIFDSVSVNSFGRQEFARGDGYYLYLTAFAIAIMAVITRLMINIRLSAKDSQERFALKAVLFTAVVSTAYGVLMNIVVPVVTNSQSYIGLGMLAVDLFAIGFAFSVFHGRLLDVRLYAVRSVGYALSLITLALLYGALVFVTSQTVLNSPYSVSQILVNIVFMLLLSFLFQPIRLFFDKLTRRFFYRDGYDTDEFFARFNRILTSTTDLTKLLETSAGEIERTLNAEQAFFFVNRPDGRDILIGAARRDRSLRGDIRDAESDLEAAARETKVVITALLSRNDPLHKLLTKRKIAIVLPLFTNKVVIGYLFLGDQRSRRYTSRDINTFSTLADELAIAIHNSLSVDEIKALNETLQQRIQEATSELRNSNDQLKRLDAAKDEFVSMASHQLRTPLTSVKGYISMVLEGDAGEVTPMQRQLLEEAFASSERMVHLISDFLNVSRLQTGKFVVDRTPVDLPKLVKQEVDSLASTAHAHSLKLKYRKPAYFPELFLDEGKIRQVVMNFIDNAIYYSPEHSTIEVALTSSDGDAVLTVHDSGIGVPKDQQAHLFTKFFRADNARRQRPDGTGVGLYLAKKVIVAHGGSMVFESIEGEGSTFGFRLPIKKLSTPTVESAESRDAAGKA